LFLTDHSEEEKKENTMHHTEARLRGLLGDMLETLTPEDQAVIERLRSQIQAIFDSSPDRELALIALSLCGDHAPCNAPPSH
jgi:hypothetical protein